MDENIDSIAMGGSDARIQVGARAIKRDSRSILPRIMYSQKGVSSS